MASIINASTSGAGGLISTADNSGVLNLQSGGTTIAAVTLTGVAVTGTVADSTATLRPLISGTAVASTSGTSIDFTSIPSWVKRITVMFSTVSTSGANSLLLQLGSGSVDSASYTSTTAVMVSNTSYNAVSISSTGFGIANIGSSADSISGSVILTTLGSNIWVVQSILTDTSTRLSWCAGTKTLSGTLDRVRITTVNGTDTFDAGSINIMYE
jgi:hypothetical protein